MAADADDGAARASIRVGVIADDRPYRRSRIAWNGPCPSVSALT
jgi:hypothetical protein